MKTITGSLHEDQCTFMIISRSVRLRMKNASDTSCIEIQSAQFMFYKVSPKIVLFMR